MNRQNRLILALLVVIFSGNSTRAQILVGPVIGGQVGLITFKDKSNKDLYKMNPYFGFHAGGSISFRVQKAYFLQSSIIYYQRGKTLEAIGVRRDRPGARVIAQAREGDRGR